MSVNELDAKVGGTLDQSKKVLEATSGNYLDRMESFLSKHDNATLEEMTKENDEDYFVDIDWKIPQKETCDIGENTVVSVKNQLFRRARSARVRLNKRKISWFKPFNFQGKKPYLETSGRKTSLEKVRSC